MIDREAEPQETTQSAPWPSYKAGWTLVVLLTVAYIFSFVDRYILGLLIEPIKADLGLTDEQIGWVIGPAFAVFYATMGLPLGWLVDRKRRTLIVAAGVAVWSLATAASGLATKFWHLFAARMLVGAGEATLSPAAFSMIGDSFPPEKRGKPVAFYSMALTLGAGIASLIGGAVLLWAKSTESVDMGALGTIKPWQLTFFAVGLPGLVVAVLFTMIKEPARRTTAVSTPDLEGNSFRHAMGYVARHWNVYLGFVSLVSVMTVIAYSQGFLPSVFERTWGWPREKYAFANGVALLAFGPATVFSAGWMSDRMSQQGKLDAPFRLLALGYVIMFASGFIPYFVDEGWIAFAILCINTVGIATVSAVGVTALLLITPAPIRGQIVALYYVVISMTGLLLGPTTVGSLSTRVFGEEDIRYAMASIVLIYGTFPLLLIPIIGRLFRKQMRELTSSKE